MPEARFCICGCPSSTHVNERCRTRRYSPDGPLTGGGGRYWLCDCGGYVEEPGEEGAC